MKNLVRSGLLAGTLAIGLLAGSPPAHAQVRTTWIPFQVTQGNGLWVYPGPTTSLGFTFTRFGDPVFSFSTTFRGSVPVPGLGGGGWYGGGYWGR